MPGATGDVSRSDSADTDNNVTRRMSDSADTDDYVSKRRSGSAVTDDNVTNTRRRSGSAVTDDNVCSTWFNLLKKQNKVKFSVEQSLLVSFDFC